MGKMYTVSLDDWRTVLLQFIHSYSFYAPLEWNGSQDYELIDEENAGEIIYNHPKPSTPLKTFLLPVKENVTLDFEKKKRTLIMGVPSCDLAALDILDEMYLHRDYRDIYYKYRRENTILIGYDCHTILKNCHCTAYGVSPYPIKNYDLLLARFDDRIILRTGSARGAAILKELENYSRIAEADKHEIRQVEEQRNIITGALNQQNKNLPGYETSGKLVGEQTDHIWKKYSSTCVSCGACATICPTCTCFLLVDRPDFQKVRQLDACQYPGFERVAAGEDPLEKMPVRFRNRFQCKYIWKPLKFKSLACTGCGRCIDTCIGRISKNELLEELASEKNHGRI